MTSGTFPSEKSQYFVGIDRTFSPCGMEAMPGEMVKYEPDTESTPWDQVTVRARRDDQMPNIPAVQINIGGPKDQVDDMLRTLIEVGVLHEWPHSTNK